MKKHRIDKIREVSGTTEKETSPEHDEQNRKLIADKLLEIVLKTPKDAPPVKESFSELLAELHTPRRAPVIVNRADGKRIEVCRGNTKILSGGESENLPASVTKNDSESATKNLPASATKFSDEELLILEQIQNG